MSGDYNGHPSILGMQQIGEEVRREHEAEVASLRAKLRDREARLKAARNIKGVGDGGERTRSKAFGKALRRITDLRRKNWRGK